MSTLPNLSLGAVGHWYDGTSCQSCRVVRRDSATMVTVAVDVYDSAVTDGASRQHPTVQRGPISYVAITLISLVPDTFHFLAECPFLQ